MADALMIDAGISVDTGGCCLVVGADIDLIVCVSSHKHTPVWQGGCQYTLGKCLHVLIDR